MQTARQLLMSSDFQFALSFTCKCLVYYLFFLFDFILFSSGEPVSAQVVFSEMSGKRRGHASRIG